MTSSEEDQPAAYSRMTNDGSSDSKLTKILVRPNQHHSALSSIPAHVLSNKESKDTSQRPLNMSATVSDLSRIPTRVLVNNESNIFLKDRASENIES